MPSWKRVFEGLTKSRLRDLARNFDITGLTGLPRDDIAGAPAAKRSLAIEKILELLNGEELKMEGMRHV